MRVESMLSRLFAHTSPHACAGEGDDSSVWMIMVVLIMVGVPRKRLLTGKVTPRRGVSRQVPVNNGASEPLGRELEKAAD